MKSVRIFRAGFGLSCVFGCLAALFPLAAQPPKAAQYSEYQLKAQYLSDLGRYVEWTTRTKPDDHFEICVLGQDPFSGALDAAVTGENIGGAPLVIRRLTRAQDAASCRVLFISSSEESQLDSILATLGTASTLTVSDIPDFVKRRGMIQFILDGNLVRFEINIAASQRAGLRLSSNLLKLARVVRRTL